MQSHRFNWALVLLGIVLPGCGAHPLVATPHPVMRSDLAHNDLGHNALEGDALLLNAGLLKALGKGPLNGHTLAMFSDDLLRDDTKDLVKYIISCALPKDV